MTALQAMVAGLVMAAALPAGAEDWDPAPPAKVRQTALAWLRGRTPPAAVLRAAEDLWKVEPAGDPLARLVYTVALVEPRAAALVDRCSKPHQPGPVPDEAWLREPGVDPLVANNLRLYYARWLVHQRLLDEAAAQLEGLRPEEVADPSAVLFYQAVVYQRLLDPKRGLAAVDRLLAHAESSPQRYVAVARLLAEDLKSIEEDSLDHIARRMDDIHRRLDLGRGGPNVRKLQDGVIESLDKLIKELEERQKQQQQSAAASGNQSSRPAEESRIMGGKGPGEVTQRDVGGRSGWGNLPPKQRDEALQQIGRDFPAHYREIVEQYFKKLATEGK